MERRLTGHLRDRQLKDGDNQRLLKGIGVQMSRGRLLTFLQARWRGTDEPIVLSGCYGRP